MTTVASLRILLGLDSKDVRDGAGSVKSELKGVQAEANTTQRTFDALTVSAKSLVGAYLGFQGIQAVTGFLTESVKAAQEDEASTARLTAALKANAPAWEGQTQAIDKAIKSAQQLGFTDDQVRDSLGRLTAATHDVGQSIEILNTAQDLARFKNVSLEEATQSLITIEAGRFRGLAQLGIQLKDGATQTEALAAVQKVAAGAAEAFGQTSAGAAEEAGIAFKEAQESIGRGLLPVVTELSHFARDVLAPALTIVGDNIGIVVDAAEALTVALGVKIVGGWVASAAAAVASSTTQVGAIGAVTAAFDALKLSAALAWVAQLGPAGLAAGGAFLAYLGITEVVKADTQARKEALPVLQDLSAQQNALNAQLADGTITQDEYNRASDALVVQQRQAIAAAGDAKVATQDQSAAQADATATANAQTAAVKGLADAATLLSTTTDAATVAAVKAAQSGAGWQASLKGAAEAVGTLTGPINDLGAALDALPREVTIDVVTKFTSTGAGAFAVGEFPQGPAGNASNAPTLGSTGSLTGTSADPEVVARQQQAAAEAARRAAQQATADAQRAADAANRKAAEDARALADAQIEQGRRAFEELKAAAHRFFDDLHDKNLKAIQDAKDRADAEIEQQKRANLAPVDAAQAALRAIQQAREFERLRADVANAQTPEDRLRAQQALADFVAQQQIDVMRANADAANAALDTQKAAQDAAFAAQKQAEDDRYRAQVTAFDQSLADLQKYLEKHPALWKKNTDAIIAVLKAAGVDFTKAGQDNANAYIAGINAAFSGVHLPTLPGTTSPASPPEKSTRQASGFAPADTLGYQPPSRIALETVGSVANQSALAQGLSLVGGGPPGDVYLDGEKVGAILGKRQGMLLAIYSPQGVSSGSKR